MKKFTTLGGSLFLIWLLFSPVIAFYLFANYYDSLAAHGVNLLSLLVLSYLFFGLVGALLMRGSPSDNSSSAKPSQPRKL